MDSPPGMPSGQLKRKREEDEVKCNVPTLKSMVLEKLKQCYRDIDDVGSLLYEEVLPFISLIRDPSHLHALEQNSPHLIPHTSLLWQKIIYERFRIDPETLAPPAEDPDNWYLVYEHELEKEKRREKESVEALKRQFQNLEAEKNSKRAVLINETPSLSRRRSGYGSGPSGFGSGAGGIRSPAKMSALEKARREAQAYKQNMSNAALASRNRPVGNGLTNSLSARGIVSRAIPFQQTRPVISRAPNTTSAATRAKHAEQIAKERAKARVGQGKVVAAPTSRAAGSTWKDRERERENRRKAESVEDYAVKKKRKAEEGATLEAKWSEENFMGRLLKGVHAG